MKERIIELTKQLNEANHRYYVLDDPIMLDFEYDRLRDYGLDDCHLLPSLLE